MIGRREFLRVAAGGIAAAASGCEQWSSQGKKRVGIAYALGGKGDQSYNDAAARALSRLRELFEVVEFSPATLDDYPRALATLGESQLSAVFCVGFIYDTFVKVAARKHTKTYFCVLDGNPDAGNNTLGVQFRVEEASALAGIVAADRTQSGRIGFVGGSDILPIRAFLSGYSDGARKLKPTIVVETSFVGSGAEAFTDAARGKDIALRLLDGGVDVIFHAAGGSGNGVIAAARERNKLAIGVDVDQTHLAPGTVITNVLKRLDNAILKIAEEISRGTPPRSGILTLGLKDGGVQITDPGKLSIEGAKIMREVELSYGLTS